jgi:hypothetical protein
MHRHHKNQRWWGLGERVLTLLVRQRARSLLVKVRAAGGEAVDPALVRLACARSMFALTCSGAGIRTPVYMARCRFSAWRWQYAHSGNRYTQTYHTHNLKVDPKACVYLHSGLGFLSLFLIKLHLQCALLYWLTIQS